MTIWQKAAKAIAEGKEFSSCFALYDSANCTSDHISRKRFPFWFQPESKTSDDLWFGPKGNPQNQLARSLALLIMEQIEKDERRASHVYVYKLFWRRNVRNLERRTK